MFLIAEVAGLNSALSGAAMLPLTLPPTCARRDVIDRRGHAAIPFHHGHGIAKVRIGRRLGTMSRLPVRHPAASDAELGHGLENGTTLPIQPAPERIEGSRQKAVGSRQVTPLLEI
jgi:hypothetical protein